MNYLFFAVIYNFEEHYWLTFRVQSGWIR